MTDLDLETYFEAKLSLAESLPLIRFLMSEKGNPVFHEAKVKILRDPITLGSEPTEIELRLFDNKNNQYSSKTDSWDTELNNALINRQIRAVDESNETLRFGLTLYEPLEQAESRYGVVFFNSVLIAYIDQGPFGTVPEIEKLRKYIFPNPLDPNIPNYEDCWMMIQAVFQDRWVELRRKLGYDKDQATRILSGAIRNYLDERYRITVAINFGWIKVK